MGGRFAPKAPWEGYEKRPVRQPRYGNGNYGRHPKAATDRDQFARKWTTRRPGSVERHSLLTQMRSDFRLGRRGSRYGIPTGYLKEEALKHMEEAKVKSEFHFALIMKKFPETSEIVQKATQVALDILNNPTQQKLALDAAKLLFDNYHEKPRAKSEVTVKQAEDWLAELAETEAQEADAEQPQQH